MTIGRSSDTTLKIFPWRFKFKYVMDWTHERLSLKVERLKSISKMYDESLKLSLTTNTHAATLYDGISLRHEMSEKAVNYETIDTV